MSSFILTIILFGVITLFPTISCATTPVVSSVSGTITTGQTLTVTGTSMVDENKTNWWSKFQTGNLYGFETGDYAEDFDADEAGDYFGEAPDSGIEGTRSYTTSTKLDGNACLYARIQDPSGSGRCYAGYYFWFLNEQTEFYERFYIRFHSAHETAKWPTEYMKMSYVNGFESYYQPQADYPDGDSLPTGLAIRYDGASHDYSVDNFLEDGRWYCVEARRKANSPANFTVWVDGVQIVNVSPPAGSAMSNTYFGMVNVDGTLAGTDIEAFIDNYVLSTARIYPSSKIEIGNNADYSLATKVYQAPTSLSDTSILITADLTGLGAGPYYLWVTNNKQERSSAYNLSGTTTSSITGISITGGSFQ